MPDIVIYTGPNCPYCVRAKALLDRKGLAYREINAWADDATRDEMTRRAGGRRTVPQIFVGDHHVGGCDDLYALDAKGELDKLVTP